MTKSEDCQGLEEMPGTEMSSEQKSDICIFLFLTRNENFAFLSVTFGMKCTLLCLYYVFVDLAVVEDAETGHPIKVVEKKSRHSAWIHRAQAVGMALDRGYLHEWRPRGRREHQYTGCRWES